MRPNSKLSFIRKLNKKAPDGSFMYLCQCECGNTAEVPSTKFKHNRILSCGCLRGKAHTHNMTKHPCMARYKAMLARCYNPKNASYSGYGGRGITVCDRWREPLPEGFLNFIKDMGNPPPKHSLERKNNDLGYSPENCIWAPMNVQANNKRNNRLITIAGDTKTLSQWAKELNTTTYRVTKALEVYGNDIELVRLYCSTNMYCVSPKFRAMVEATKEEL